jgi:hypothetical protein
MTTLSKIIEGLDRSEPSTYGYQAAWAWANYRFSLFSLTVDHVSPLSDTKWAVTGTIVGERKRVLHYKVYVRNSSKSGLRAVGLRVWRMPHAH